MGESGEAERESFFSGPPPESVVSVRPNDTGSPSARPGQPVRAGMSAAELRLYVWCELPERHRNEVCRQIRTRCEAFISSVRVDRSERKPETDRLVSEVVAHLLRATSVRVNEPDADANMTDDEATDLRTDDQAAPRAGKPEGQSPQPWLGKGAADDLDPTRDGRVIWVIDDICNRQALFHRYEDLRRRDRGGKWDGSGYPLVAVDNETIEQLSGHYDPAEEETDSLEAEDSRRAWEGLIELTAQQFGPGDDVVAVVRILAEDRDTQESFGSQWPIGKIVRALNTRATGQTWTDDRVDNAKKRLTKFIVRIKQKNGLDAVDLRALLARYARTRGAAAKDPPRTR